MRSRRTRREPFRAARHDGRSIETYIGRCHGGAAAASEAMMRRGPDIEAAYHEAGHAVMEMLGCYYRRKPRLVSIVPNPKENSRGHVQSHSLKRSTREALGTKVSPSVEWRLRDMLMVSLAGGEAARRKLGRATGLDGDRDTQGDLMSGLALDQGDQRAWWTLLRNEARRKLNRDWPAVEALAEALLERKKISGREAYVIAVEALDQARGGGRLVQSGRELRARAARRG